MRGPRFLVAALLLAGVFFGFGSGFASLAHGGGGWCDHGCPHERPADPQP
jgi:hypothetical protein